MGNRQQEIELFNLQSKAERLRKLYFKDGSNEKELEIIEATIKRLKDKILEQEIPKNELQEAYNIALEEINKLNNDNNKLRKKIKGLG